MTQKETIFLGSRLTQLREKNGVKSLQAMMDLLNNSGNDEYAVYNKSTLSRVESASVGEKTVVKWAKAYCDVLGYSEKQTELFLRGDKIAVPDTSALMKNPQLVEELGEEYNMVVIPDIVIRELDGIKNSNSGAMGTRAWEIIRGIGYGVKWAKAYCDVLGYSEKQTELFLRGDKIAVPDTSALMKNPQLVEELGEEYNMVVIPDIVIRELDGIKNSNSGAMGTLAWEIIRGIGYGERVIKMDYNGDKSIEKDEQIIIVAKEAAELYKREVQIITDDADYSAFLKGDDTVTALHLREYMITKQKLVNMKGLVELDKYYADDYSDVSIPDEEEINAFLPDGNTLIISIVRNRSHSFEQKKEKIRWLISNGADVNKRDCNRRYFPPLTHAIQMGDYPMFMFLLNECQANPNIGSRNPHDAGKLRQREKNEGNMPLMVAAWDGKAEFVKALCADERTSINQQDANGFTALIKACANGFTVCRDILLQAGADTKIVDIDDMNYQDRYNECLEQGKMKFRHKSKKHKKSSK